MSVHGPGVKCHPRLGEGSRGQSAALVHVKARAGLGESRGEGQFDMIGTFCSGNMPGSGERDGQQRAVRRAGSREG